MANAPLEESGEKLAKSAEKLEHSSERIEDTADRRTELAADRTVFAAERTYAAWVRTGLFALASGVGSKKLLAGLMPSWLIIPTGTVLLLFSGFCFAAAVWRNLNPGAPPPRPDVHRLPPFLLVAINGLLVVIVAAALIGIWLGGGGE
jgi:putative membrane protein